MILARGQAAPLRFLLFVTLAWIAGRGAVIAGWRPAAGVGVGAFSIHPGASPIPIDPAASRAASASLVSNLVRTVEETAHPVAREAEAWRPVVTVALADLRSIEVRRPTTIARPTPGDSATAPNRIALASAATRTYARATGATQAAAIAGDPMLALASPTLPRWSGSIWAFVRGSGHAAPLSPDGQIGAGQAGARILYRLDDRGRLAAAARLSRTIGGPRQAEAALGLDWRPFAAVPVHLMADRRFAIDRGGRNAWTLGAAGGVYAVPIAPRWRLDGYGEAGVVGAHRRNLYADGAVRAGRILELGHDRSLTLGAGAWGAAQPHAARLDAGPTAVLRVPVERRTVALALDYRQRIAGRARPHSGVALTVGVDF